jgi:hypothetical protein
MANNKRPPLEMDDLTNNLKQSSGQGIGAFSPHNLHPTERKNRLFRKNKIKKIYRTAHFTPSSMGYPLLVILLKRQRKEK